MMIRALIFDFDGLVLDTELPAFVSWQEIYREYDRHLPLSTWVTCIGTADGAFDPLDYLEGQLGGPVDREAVRFRRDQRKLELARTQRVLPGVQDCIADAKRMGLKLGLASTSARDWVTEHLLRLGLIEHFDTIKCADDVRRTKPDPELYHAVLDALGVRADEAIALEDSPNGIMAAKRAGIFCVVVPNSLTRHLSLAHADRRLTSLADLPLERLLREIQKKGG
ncbi:MAG: HAD family hydrolase [Anaerolineae bacterium]